MLNSYLYYWSAYLGESLDKREAIFALTSACLLDVGSISCKINFALINDFN